MICLAVVGTLSQSDYRWGPSANQITGVHAGVARTGVVHKDCTCRGTGVVPKGCVCRGCTHKGGGDTHLIRLQGLHARVVGTLSQSDYRGCVQGLRARVECEGVVHKGCTHKGCVRRGCTQGLCTQGCTHKGCAHKGCACKGCACKGGGDTQPIRLQRLRARVVGTLSR